MCVQHSAEQTNDSSKYCACEVVMCCLAGLSYSDWWYEVVVELWSAGGNRIISDKILLQCHLSTTHLIQSYPVNEPEGPGSKDSSSTTWTMTHCTTLCIKDTHTHRYTHRYTHTHTELWLMAVFADISLNDVNYSHCWNIYVERREAVSLLGCSRFSLVGSLTTRQLEQRVRLKHETAHSCRQEQKQK